MEDSKLRELHYQVSKLIAEADSIGEGYGYCSKFTREMFNKPGEVECEYMNLALEIIDLVRSSEDFSS